MFRTLNILNKISRNCRFKSTGAEIVYHSLLEHNVRDAFIYSGGSIMPLIDQFYNGPINYFINTHEQNSGHAATGYAKSTNKTGVVITTSGPGATNLITPALDSQNDSTPLVMITGQVGLKNMGTDAFQEAPSTEITKAFTKASILVKDIMDIKGTMDYAFKLANDGKKGVVHIDLPKCVSTNILEGEHSNIYEEEINIIINKNKLIKKLKTQKLYLISEAINKSIKPIMILGQGSLGNKKKLLEVIEKNNIPFTTTIHAKGIINDNHPLSLSWLGMHGHAGANYLVQEADCIIAVGSRFDDRTTGNPDLYSPNATKKKQIIHVDIDKNQFNKSINSHINLNSSAKDFLEDILPVLTYNNRKEWTNKVKDFKEKYKFRYRIPEDNKINTPMAINSINEFTKNLENVKISTGVGNHQMMTYQFINGNYEKKIFSSGSLGVMGAGLPYAIGIQIANSNDLVIDIDGDSSFMMTCSDMKTIMEYNLPIKIAIMNDSKQMMVNIWERLFFEERYTATINNKNPNFTALAESFGIKSFKIDNQHTLQEITNKFLSHKGPALCEYVVEPEICLPLVGPGKALDDMIMFEDYHYKKKNMILDKSSVPS
uniref:Thiamine pyrophosphate enzyme, N-terminal TPP binding domain protein n=1 Tax=Mimiviridae sp. ChoanoV1 TaxID=2596887 RepID=A0A5B8IFG6_9VIRU|nr:thiamine pyrophosphate enzyme, N-terminal TPP binding domain protein [Mimiviridae sp. ChoanoV1]